MRPLTDEEIQTMIAKRNKGKGDFIKSATTRRVLNEQREIAVAEGNDAEVIRLDRELQELEDQNAGPARGETQMQRMARLNVENRKRNQAEVRMAEIAEKRAAREALARSQKDGGSYANPFMRVKTSVKFRHDIDESSAGKSKEVAVGGSPPIKAEDGKAPNGVGLLGPAKGRKKGGVDDVIASMDLGIEIDI